VKKISVSIAAFRFGVRLTVIKPVFLNLVLYGSFCILILLKILFCKFSDVTGRIELQDSNIRQSSSIATQ
jgi:hypothetical protein